MSSNIKVLMHTAHSKEGSRMFMHFVFHGTAHSPMGKAPNQAQSELKQTRTGHQGKAIYVNTAAQTTLVKT